LKVHELDSFNVTHSAKYPGPVMACAMSPDGNALAVGTANKLLSIRRRSKPRSSLLDNPGGGGGSGGGVGGGFPVGRSKKGPRRLDAGSYMYFIRGQNEKAAEAGAYTRPLFSLT
jgi:U3 small nucleolar RNA-associated protein 15